MSSTWPNNPNLLYQPIAHYWERCQDGSAGAAERQAAESACRQIGQLKIRLGENVLPIDLECPTELEVLPGPPPNLLAEVITLLGKGAHAALPPLFPELLAYYQQWEEQLSRFAARYGTQKELLEAIRMDLNDYQEAVGALVEQAWPDAAALVVRVARHLDLRTALMERVRRQQGYSGLAELDHLAWTLHSGQADGGPAQARLLQAGSEASHVLLHEFPDPRLRSEWTDLWAPMLQELHSSLATAPDLGLVVRLEEFFERQSHWVGRARQQRDFGRIGWWQGLRENLVGWYRGLKLRSQAREWLASARSWLQLDFQDWPEPDRGLRHHYAEVSRQWLDRIDRCLGASAREQLAPLVAFGDLHYDRWLWLAQAPEALKA